MSAALIEQHAIGDLGSYYCIYSTEGRQRVRVWYWLAWLAGAFRDRWIDGSRDGWIRAKLRDR